MSFATPSLMAYTVRLVVSILSGDRCSTALKLAVRNAGGIMESAELGPTQGDSVDGTLTIRIPQTRDLHAVVRSVEKLRGVAVREVRDLRPVHG